MPVSAASTPTMAKRDYDYLFKLVLIGDSGVGKSCLLLRFAVSAPEAKGREGDQCQQGCKAEPQACTARKTMIDCMLLFPSLPPPAGRCLHRELYQHHRCGLCELEEQGLPAAQPDCCRRGGVMPHVCRACCCRLQGSPQQQQGFARPPPGGKLRCPHLEPLLPPLRAHMPLAPSLTAPLSFYPAEVQDRARGRQDSEAADC